MLAEVRRLRAVRMDMPGVRLPATFLLHHRYVAVQYTLTWWGKPRAKAQRATGKSYRRFCGRTVLWDDLSSARLKR
jgi:hypothetical protein